MKLALTIGNDVISLPPSIENINKQAGNLGGGIVKLGINLLLFGAVILSLFFIIYGGIKWIMSEGDSKNIEAARGTIFNAVIGLFIAFFAIMIINVLGKFFGVPLLGQ